MAERTQSCNGERGQYFGLLLTYTENSTSVANNTSNVTIIGTIRATSAGYSYYGATSTGKLYIDGTQVTSGSSTATVDTSGVTLFNWTGNITHNSDGKKTATVKFVFDTTYGRLTETTMEFSWTLTAIPRASSISLSASSLTLNNTTGTLTYTVTSKGNFWHKLTWSVGSLSSTIWTAQNINATSKSGTVNFGQILDKLPTSTSGTVTFTVTTYTDSGATKQSGSSSASCSVTIDTGAIKPSVSLGNIGVNSPSSFTYLVAGHSTAKVTSTTTNSRGASAVTTRFTISKGSMTASSTTSTSYTATTATLPASTSNYTFTITAQATDSRGVKSTAVTKTSGTVYAYASPVLTVNFFRVNASGETTPDPAGEWVYIQFSAVQNYKVNNWNTTLTVTGKKDGTTVTSGTTSALADTSSATLVVTATDKVTTVTKTLTVGTATFPLDLYDDAEGTVGVGMGTTAVGNKVKSNMEFDVVDGSNVVQSAMYPSGNMYSRKNVVSGETTDTVEINHTVRSQAGEIRLYSGPNTRGLRSDDGAILVVNPDGRTIIYGADASGSNKVLIGHNGGSLWIGCEKTGTTHHLGNTYIDAGYDSTNSQGYPSICISVPNTANNSATNYYVYHEGYKPTPQDIGFTNTMVQTGVSIINSRLKTLNGGYCIVGKMVFVSFTMQFNATMSAPDWWEILSGMPKPARGSALSCAGLQLKGTFNAYVGNDQKLIIATSNLSLKSGNWLIVTGFYYQS